MHHRAGINKMTKTRKKLWTGLLIMVLISPLGIILPELLNSGDTWGEWGTDAMEKLIGFVPEGLKKYSDTWTAPVPDYNLGDDESSLTVKVISYIGSGLIGIIAVSLVIYLLTRMVLKNGR